MRFSRGKIWFVDIGPCKRFDIFQLWNLYDSLWLCISLLNNLVPRIEDVETMKKNGKPFLKCVSPNQESKAP